MGRGGETVRDEIEGLVSGILVMADLDADPLTSKEHILLSNLVEQAWKNGQSLDLPTLIGQIQQPPLRRLGVFDLDTFFPEKERTKLAMRLNGLVASPSFAEWIQGEPLDMEGLLRAPDGRPRASIVYLSHLSESERVFVVTLLLSKLVTWMRQQAGDLGAAGVRVRRRGHGVGAPHRRAPLQTAHPHPVQAGAGPRRGCGVGHPEPGGSGLQAHVQRRDLDDRPPADREGQGPNHRGAQVRLGRRRRGGVGRPNQRPGETAVRAQDGPLPPARTLHHPVGHVLPAGALHPDGAASAQSPSAPDDCRRRNHADRRPRPTRPDPPSGCTGQRLASLAPDESPVPPAVASGIAVRFLDPGAPWAKELGVVPGGRRLEAGLAARVRVLFDDQRGDLRHEEEWEAVFFPLEGSFEAETAHVVDHDRRDFREEAQGDVVYALPEPSLDKADFFRSSEKAIEEHLYRNLALTLFRNDPLKLYSRVGESEDAFRKRCLAAAEEQADAEAEKLRARYESKLKTARSRVSQAERRARELEVDTGQRRQQELIAGAGDVLSMFLGGRRRTRSLSGISSRRSQTLRTKERLQSAEEKLEEYEEAIQELEENLGAELQDIWEKWKNTADEMDAFEVGLEKTDIHLDDLFLFWAPTA